MPGENVELARHGYEAFARGDIDELLELVDPEVEWAPIIAPILGIEPMRGKDALRRFFTQEIAESLEDFAAKPLSIEEVDDGTVLIRTQYSGHGRESGVPVSLEVFSLLVVRNRKAISFRDYETKAEALEAAGLSE